MRKYLAATMLTVVLILSITNTHADPNFDGSTLTGFTNVNVGGDLYNVAFMDGTCADLYSGCDEVSDFPFTNATEVDLANSAVLALLLAGSFDVNPIDIAGCSDDFRCGIWTPFGLSLASFVDAGRVFINDTGFNSVQSILGAWDPNNDLALFQRHNTWAVWKSSASEPATLTCVGFESPMDGGPVKVKKNRALPLKAQLYDGITPINDLDITAPPVIQVMFAAGAMPAVDVTDDALSAGAGTEGNQFEFLDSIWQLNLKTKNYTAAGTYTITMESGDTDEYLVDPTCTASFVIN